jgi:hypothetical protein
LGYSGRTGTVLALCRPLISSVGEQLKSEFILLQGMYLNTIGNYQKCILTQSELTKSDGVCLAQKLLVKSQTKFMQGEIYESCIEAMKSYRLISKAISKKGVNINGNKGVLDIRKLLFIVLFQLGKSLELQGVPEQAIYFINQGWTMLSNFL